jgi:hypothetical protein
LIIIGPYSIIVEISRVRNHSKTTTSKEEKYGMTEKQKVVDVICPPANTDTSYPQKGYWLFRLAEDPSIYADGITKEGALEIFLSTAESAGESGNIADYVFLMEGERTFYPSENPDNEAYERARAKQVRTYLVGLVILLICGILGMHLSSTGSADKYVNLTIVGMFAGFAILSVPCIQALKRIKSNNRN